MKFEKRFHTRFGPGTVTFPMKVEDWAIRRDDALGRFVLTFIVPWLKELYIKLKTKETMADVDRQTRELVEEPQIPNPWVSVKEDPTNPFGVSEIRATYDFKQNDSEVSGREVPSEEKDS